MDVMDATISYAVWRHSAEMKYETIDYWGYSKLLV